MEYKQKFIEIYQENIHREGADKLLEWLQTTDFFTAPASTRFHCACPEGLVTLFKGKAVIDRKTCLDCGRCVKACPALALSGPRGWRIYLGGCLGRRPRLALPLPGVFPRPIQCSRSPPIQRANCALRVTATPSRGTSSSSSRCAGSSAGVFDRSVRSRMPCG